MLLIFTEIEGGSYFRGIVVEILKCGTLLIFVISKMRKNDIFVEISFN